MASNKAAAPPPHLATDRRLSKWESMLRTFSDAQKVECKAVPLEMPRVHRSVKNFPTGSKYEGTWDVLGMSGHGTYTFPNGVVYVGEFEDGMFHGDGELQYPNGVTLKGTWQRGDMMQRTLIFDDGLQYQDENWEYCKMPDRRFTVEANGLQPAGESYMTAQQPSRHIPPGMYDTGDGFYDPNKKIVYQNEECNSIQRAPLELEQQWIVDNCRTNPDGPRGPLPDLYEQWTRPQLELVRPPSPTNILRRLTSVFQAKSTADMDIGELPFKPLMSDTESDGSTCSSTSDISLFRRYY